MSCLKPQKTSFEGRIYETLTSTFPHFKCSIADIKFPKKEFVISFYCFILEELQFNVPKLLQGPLEKQLEKETQPELLSDTLQLVNLSQALKALLLKLQNGDGLSFGLMDLVDPNVSRNSVFMFTLLNFFNFANTRMTELHSKSEIIYTRKAELKKILETREKISRELQQRALLKTKRLDFAKELKTKKSEMEEMQGETKSLEQMSDKKQLELEDSRRKLSRVQSELNELKITFKKLEALQVQSPDALRNNYKHLQEKLMETKQLLEQTQQNAKDKRKAVKFFQTAEKDQDTRLTVLADIVNESKTVMELEKQHVDLQAKLKTELSETEALQAVLNDLKKELAHRSAQLTNLQLQWEKTKSSMKENIRHLTEENKILELKQGKELEGTLQMIQDVQMEVDDLIEENNRFNKHCEKLYEDLNHKEQSFIDQKNAELDAKIAELEQASKK